MCIVTARNWRIISPTSFNACHTPVTMLFQQSPTNTMRSYVSPVVNDIESHDVCDALRVFAQAFVDQVRRAGPSNVGCHATFD